MKIARTLVVSVSLAFCSTGLFAQYGQGPPPPPGAYGQGGYNQGDRDRDRDRDRDGDRGRDRWDAPPQEFQEYARRGFQDGIEGARRDVENHRRPTPNNRDEFRHPNVPGQFRRDYRDGFRRGYTVAMEHMNDRR